MNKLQQTEFEMLKIFIEVCAQLNLTYYLVCGSALGATKYGGFIPWDDDMDVALLREEYEVFCNKAPSLLPDGIFLQTYETDKNYPNIFAKLRNSNTTYIEKSTANIAMNHGVYIDIFPLDGYPRNLKIQKEFEKQKLLYKKKLSCAFIHSGIKAKVKYIIKLLLGYGRNRKKTLEEYTAMISQYSPENSDYICNHGNWQGKLEYAPKEQYGKGIMMKFEGLDVRVPEQYDAYLTQKYGDWRADLPIEQQVGHHYYTVLDVDNPYTMYMKKK